MDATQKLIARRLLRGRIHESRAGAYQRLFEQIMIHRDQGFVPIKPYGSIGDRKNDGYIPETGTYFQVYSPEDPSNARSAVEAAKKAAVDFSGLLEYWNETTPVQRFRFVFNDSYRGSPPPLELALRQISNDHQIPASSLLASHLEDLALELPADRLADVLNCPVPEVGPIDSIDFGILREVVAHVMESRRPFVSSGNLQAPDFDEKIQFNGLTTEVARLLGFAAFQIEAIDQYFSNHSLFAKQQLRDHLNALYSECRATMEEQNVAAADLGDVVFFLLVSKLTPSAEAAKQFQSAAIQDAVFVVMAYYFEACDIFEDPSASS